jgi:hypothetical protein
LTEGARTRYHITGYLIFVIISLLVYSRAFDNGFRQDDYVYVRHVETTSFLDSLRPSSDFTFYRPGAMILFRLEYGIFAHNSGAYIVFNFLVHLASSFLMLLVLRRIRSFRGSETTAAGLFLLGLGHYGKTVMWACCSGQLVSIALSLAGILLSLHCAGCRSAADRSREGRGSGYCLFFTIVIMTAAVLFHEGAIVTPVVATFAVLACQRSGRLIGPGRAMLLLLPIPLLFFMYRSISQACPAYGLDASSLRQVPGYLLRYSGFAVIPLQRTRIIVAPPTLQRLIGLAPHLHLIAGALLLAALGCLAVFQRKSVRILSVWFPAAILPFTLIALPEGWLQLRYLYYASIPLCGLAAAGFHRLVSARGAVSRTVAIIFLLLAVFCTATLVLLLERYYGGFWGA